MKCCTLECYSVAMAKSTDTDREFCIECAIKIAKHFGPDKIVTLPGMRFPWDYGVDGHCPHCGISYNRYLINVTGDCPACKAPLPEYKRPTLEMKPWDDDRKIENREGPHD